MSDATMAQKLADKINASRGYWHTADSYDERQPANGVYNLTNPERDLIIAALAVISAQSSPPHPK